MRFFLADPTPGIASTNELSDVPEISTPQIPGETLVHDPRWDNDPMVLQRIMQLMNSFESDGSGMSKAIPFFYRYGERKQKIEEEAQLVADLLEEKRKQEENLKATYLSTVRHRISVLVVSISWSIEWSLKPFRVVSAK